uniref:Cytochrome P450 n=1 Tax=Cucumis sativus TaxID=3659 RepID=A0A0A0KIZ7_CUCSA
MAWVSATIIGLLLLLLLLLLSNYLFEIWLFKNKKAASDGVSINISSKAASLITDMTCLMVFGRKFGDEELDDRGFKAMMQEVMQLIAAPNLGDFIPFIERFDLQGLNRRMINVSKVFDGFFERIIDEHLKSMGEKKTKDFLDVMLDLMNTECLSYEYRIDRSNVKAIILVRIPILLIQ